MSFGSRSSTWIGAFIVTLAFMMFTPTRAFAQNKPATWDITPFLNFNFGADLDGVSPGVGVAAGYNWTENLAFEGEFSYIPDVVGGDNNTDEPVVTLSGNGVYYFNTGTNIIPYATLGVGLGHTSVTVKNPANETSETGFQVNVGGGVKADINPRLTVRGDLRHFHTNDQPAFWRVYGGVVFKFPR
jgi:opacity protein-like surface antigen